MNTGVSETGESEARRESRGEASEAAESEAPPGEGRRLPTMYNSMSRAVLPTA